MNISQEAENLKCAAIWGLCSHQCCVFWADMIIAKEKNPKYELLEISISSTLKDSLKTLITLSQGADHFKAIRTVLGRMHYVGTQNPSLLQSFAKHLYDYVVENNCELPDDLNFLMEFNDGYYLASALKIDTIENVNKEFLDCLSEFKKEHSHLDNWYLE